MCIPRSFQVLIKVHKMDVGLYQTFVGDVSNEISIQLGALIDRGKRIPAVGNILHQITRLPFENENALLRMFHMLKQFQAYHIVQLYRELLLPLSQKVDTPAKFQAQAFELLNLSLTSCYGKSNTQRVAFAAFMSAVNFSLEVKDGNCSQSCSQLVVLLLDLLRALAAANMVDYVAKKGVPTFQETPNVVGTTHFFETLVTVFRTRLTQGNVAALIVQTIRAVRADASLAFLATLSFVNGELPCSRPPSPLLLCKWVELLQLKSVSNDCAVRLAVADALLESSTDRLKSMKLEFGQGILSQSLVCCVLQALKEERESELVALKESDRGLRLGKPEEKKVADSFEKKLDHKLTKRILDLAEVTPQAARVITEIVSCWSSKTEAVKLVDKLLGLSLSGATSTGPLPDDQLVWELLLSCGRVFVNSCDRVLEALERILALYNSDDIHSLEHVPTWRRNLISAGLSIGVMDSWCAAFVYAPLEDIKSILGLSLNFNPIASQLIVSGSISECLFSDLAKQIWSGDKINVKEFKRYLVLSRLLRELLAMTHPLKIESTQDSLANDIIINACDQLCGAFRKNPFSSKMLYKIRANTFKVLLEEVLCKPAKEVIEDGNTSDGFTTPVPWTQSALRINEIYEISLVILRRWLAQVPLRPSLASHVRAIMQLLIGRELPTPQPGPVNSISRTDSSQIPAISAKMDPNGHACSDNTSTPSNSTEMSLSDVHNLISEYILSLEKNQATIAQLQASGYNNSILDTVGGSVDLWESPSIGLSYQIKKRDSPDHGRVTETRRNFNTEWKGLLLMAGIEAVQVGEELIERDRLFSPQISLEDLKLQVTAVKIATRNLESNELHSWRSVLIREDRKMEDTLIAVHKVS